MIAYNTEAVQIHIPEGHLQGQFPGYVFPATRVNLKKIKNEFS